MSLHIQMPHLAMENTWNNEIRVAKRWPSAFLGTYDSMESAIFLLYFRSVA